MTSKTIEVFSVQRAAIIDPTTGLPGALDEFYGVRSASITADIGNSDNTGNDDILSTWYWLNYCNVTIQGGFINLDLAAKLQGGEVTTTGTGDADEHEIDLYPEDCANQPPVSLLVRAAARDKAGAVRTFDAVLYKVFLAPFTLDGPSYKNGVLINYTGRAVKSDVDENNAALTGKRRVGKLLSRVPV